MTNPTNHHSALSDTLFSVPTSKAVAVSSFPTSPPTLTISFLGFFSFFFIVTMWAGISWWFWFARPWWLVTLISRQSSIDLLEKCVQISAYFNRVFVVVVVHFLPFASRISATGYHRGKLPEGDGRRARPAGPVCALQLQQPQDACDPETGKCLVRWFVWLPDTQNKQRALGVYFSGWDHTSSLI